MLTIGLKSNIITSSKSVIGELKKALQDEKLQEKDVLIITSKVVAISQGRTKKISSPEDFAILVQREADEHYNNQPVTLTQKNGIFTPWAGIDTSNMPEGQAVLWPEKPFQTAQKLLEQLKSDYHINQLGLIISDSFCAPLRKGVTAVALGYAGFMGVNDLRGKPDLYGKELQVSQQNLADMMASSAHMVMGESTEQTPFAIVRGAHVEFTSQLTDPKEPLMPPEDCIFSPLYD